MNGGKTVTDVISPNHCMEYGYDTRCPGGSEVQAFGYRIMEGIEQ
jgi:hypothetical protein